MIDFIRNGGKVLGTQKEHLDVLENELEYWGIDAKEDFGRTNLVKDKFALIQ